MCWPAVPPELLRDVAVAADEAGLDELWLWEDCFWGGGVAACAAALAWTSRVRVGIGVLPVPLRNVALAAMETAMLYRMFPGRVTVGLGHGVQDWMRQAGAKAESPMTLLAEYLPALRALLAGQTVTASGRYVQLAEVALVWPAVPATPPIFAGAVGPKTLALSGEIADGTILVAGTGPSGLRAARERIDSGRARAGRAGAAHQLVVYLEASMDAPAEDAARQVAELAQAGADTVVLQPPHPSGDPGDPAAYVRWVAGRVRPLV